MTNPTPAGVPVAMIVPGSNVNAVEMCSISSQQLLIICDVDASCRRSSSTHVRIRRSCGSVISSVVTNHGPIGPWVSQLLPIVIVGCRALPVAHGDVVDDEVPGDDVGGVGRLDAAAALPDHHPELALVVDPVGRDGRHLDRTRRSGDARDLLVEHDRPVGLRHARLGDVGAVVEPDREEASAVGRSAPRARRRRARSAARSTPDRRPGTARRSRGAHRGRRAGCGRRGRRRRRGRR